MHDTVSLYMFNTEVIIIVHEIHLIKLIHRISLISSVGVTYHHGIITVVPL
jgi:hypothetical protein